MAKKKKESTAEDAKTTVAKDGAFAKSSGLDWRVMILSVALLACAVAFLPTSFLMLIGLMPTIGAFVIDPTPDKIKTLTVSFMNLAGMVPFLLHLWTSGQAQSISYAFSIIADPKTIITMYGAAACGYAIFYAVSSMVASIALHNGRVRLEHVAKRMGELERKWGREVTGFVRLDERGFPVDDAAE